MKMAALLLIWRLTLVCCFVNQLYVNGVYDVIAVSSDAQVADVGCAPRSLPVFQRHRASLRGEQK